MEIKPTPQLLYIWTMSCIISIKLNLLLETVISSSPTVMVILPWLGHLEILALPPPLRYCSYPHDSVSMAPFVRMRCIMSR
jgi:hypothetical protein